MQAEHVVDQTQRAEQDRAGADDGRNDAGGERPVERLRQHRDEQAKQRRRKQIVGRELRMAPLRDHLLQAAVAANVLQQRAATATGRPG